MEYFKHFPDTNYTFDGKTLYRAKNILRRVTFKEEIKVGRDLFTEYRVKDGDRLDTIADEVYGRPDFAWVLALYNDIIDPLTDLGYDANALDEHISKKYEGTTLVLYPGGTASTSEDQLNNVWFERGDTIYAYDYNDIVDPYQMEIRGQVLDYDPTLQTVRIKEYVGDTNKSKIGVTQVRSFTDMVGQKISTNSFLDGGTSDQRATIQRVFTDSGNAIHHFFSPVINYNGSSGSYLDPFGTPPDASGRQFTAGVTYADSSLYATTAPGFTATLLENYVTDNDATYVVTNRMHEFDLSQNRDRFIRILDPQIVQQVIVEFERLISGDD